jgi:tRNA G18 (ribose-2'-O)-methylase SpoU
MMAHGASTILLLAVPVTLTRLSLPYLFPPAASRTLIMSGESESSLPELFLLLENPKKSNNLGSVLRCASAFGIHTVVAVGYEKCAVEGTVF